MGLKTKPTKKSLKNKRTQVAELKEKHVALFKLEGVEDKAKFIPKMAYIPEPGADRIIAFFPSEIQGGEDIYTEFVSKDNIPDNPERTLWKWPFNPEFDTEYKKSEPHQATGHHRYLIPIDELINVGERYVKPVKAKESEQTKLVLDVATDDAPIGQMTIRDKAAIDWKLPVSNKAWLNELIKKECTNHSETLTLGPG